MQAAIDFGISNIDAVARIDGSFHYWTRRSQGTPDHASVRDILAEGGVPLASLPAIAVTGGQHKVLPSRLGDCAVVGVPEVIAIGRGGQALALGEGDDPSTPLLVVSAGSGTAVVSARASSYAHVTGTGVGGGTLLGLGRLLLATTDVAMIDEMAVRGDANGADLALRDVVSGPIGTLPPDATAVNFGRLARLDELQAHHRSGRRVLRPSADRTGSRRFRHRAGRVASRYRRQRLSTRFAVAGGVTGRSVGRHFTRIALPHG